MIRPLVKNKTLWLLSLALVVLSFALSAVLYDQLPDPVPSHWNLSGEADGFTAKPWGAFTLPMALAAVTLLMAALPWLSPKGFRIPVESTGYRWSVATVTFLLFSLHAVVLLAALEALSMQSALPILFGAFFLVLGNFLPTVRRNFYIGIRTPWTLADEEVWARTHRWGGRSFVAGGLAMIALAATGLSPAYAFGMLIAAALAPAVYSFVAYRSLHPTR